jgi:hypothetical protein
MKFPLSRTLKNWCKHHMYHADGWVFSDERKRLYVQECDDLPSLLHFLTFLNVPSVLRATAR